MYALSPTLTLSTLFEKSPSCLIVIDIQPSSEGEEDIVSIVGFIVAISVISSSVHLFCM